MSDQQLHILFVWEYNIRDPESLRIGVESYEDIVQTLHASKKYAFCKDALEIHMADVPNEDEEKLSFIALTLSQKSDSPLSRSSLRLCLSTMRTYILQNGWVEIPMDEVTNTNSNSNNRESSAVRFKNTAEIRNYVEEHTPLIVSFINQKKYVPTKKGGRRKTRHQHRHRKHKRRTTHKRR
jgi:hypothetical protein